MMGVEVEAVNSTSTALAALNELTQVASTQTTNFQKTMAALKDTFMQFLDAIAPVVDKIFGFVLALGTAAGVIWGYVKPAVDALIVGFNNFVSTMQTLINTFPGLFKAIGIAIGLFVGITAAIWLANKAYAVMVKGYKLITGVPKQIAKMSKA